MEYEYEEIVSRSGWISFTVGILFIVLAIVSWNVNPFTATMSLVIGVAGSVVSVIGLKRINDIKLSREYEKIGAVVIEHNWWIISIGIAALALFPFDFFKAQYYTIGFSLLSIAWILNGAIALYLSKKNTGAPLSP